MLKSQLAFSLAGKELLEQVEVFLNYMFKDSLIYPYEIDAQNKVYRYYLDDYNKILSLIANDKQAAVRSELIPILQKESELLQNIIRLSQLDELYFFNFDPKSFYLKADYIQSLIINIYIQLNITGQNLEDLFKHLLEISVYIESIRSRLVTLKRLSIDFHVEENDMKLLFQSDDGKNITTKQIVIISDYLNTFLEEFFPEYLDLFVCEMDTGTPTVEFSIKINVAIDINVQSILHEIFQHIEEDDLAHVIKKVKELRKLFEKMKKEEIKELKNMRPILNDEEYKERYMQVIDKYQLLKENGLSQIINHDTKQIKQKNPLMISAAD